MTSPKHDISLYDRIWEPRIIITSGVK